MRDLYHDKKHLRSTALMALYGLRAPYQRNYIFATHTASEADRLVPGASPRRHDGTVCNCHEKLIAGTRTRSFESTAMAAADTCQEADS
jgi:hypothetical protein